jgi:4-amino-4-deoxy-L-arabinose transferase-like glycosyltransferase
MYRAFHKHRTAWFLLAVCFLFAILRLPSLVEPHWYGDEGIYQVVGRALVSGRVLYKDIWDNKPPLLYIIYAIVNGNLFLAKLLSLLSGLASVVVFYKLSEKIFQKSRAWYLSTITYSVLFGLPILEGNIANAENFMLLPVVLAAYLVIKYSERKKNIYLIIAGLLLSIALVTKIVAVFDFFAFVIFIFIISGVGRKQDFLKPFLSFFIPLISLLLLFSLYFLSMGSFKDFASSVFLQNVSYVGDQN